MFETETCVRPHKLLIFNWRTLSKKLKRLKFIYIKKSERKKTTRSNSDKTHQGNCNSQVPISLEAVEEKKGVTTQLQKKIVPIT